MTTEAGRFYYLRIMAKRDGGPKAPVSISRPKFVHWGNTRRFSTSTEEEPELESEAMSIARNIGKAFESCHEPDTTQAQSEDEEGERLLDQGTTPSTSSTLEPTNGGEADEEDEETTTIGKVRIRHKANPNKLKARSPDQRYPSPRASPVIWSKAFPPRVSIHPPDQELDPELAVAGPPRRKSGDSASSSLIIPSTMLLGGISTNQNNPEQSGPASNGNTGSLSVSTNVGPEGQSGLHPLGLWPTGHQQHSPLLQPGQLMPSSSSVLSTLSSMGITDPSSPSSAQVSPYATLALSQLLSVGAMVGQPTGSGGLSPMRTVTPLSSSLVSPSATLTSISPTGSQGGQTINKALEHCSLTLVRSQLEQAQKQAQVAFAQVQLLRDQLSAETTARLEAQGRTHQLFMANKELVDQVQMLAGRLQNLETRMTGQNETNGFGEVSPSNQAHEEPASSTGTSDAQDHIGSDPVETTAVSAEWLAMAAQQQQLMAPVQSENGVKPKKSGRSERKSTESKPDPPPTARRRRTKSTVPLESQQNDVTVLDKHTHVQSNKSTQIQNPVASVRVRISPGPIENLIQEMPGHIQQAPRASLEERRRSKGEEKKLEKKDSKQKIFDGDLSQKRSSLGGIFAMDRRRSSLWNRYSLGQPSKPVNVTGGKERRDSVKEDVRTTVVGGVTGKDDRSNSVNNPKEGQHGSVSLIDSTPTSLMNHNRFNSKPSHGVSIQAGTSSDSCSPSSLSELIPLENHTGRRKSSTRSNSLAVPNAKDPNISKPSPTPTPRRASKVIKLPSLNDIVNEKNPSTHQSLADYSKFNGYL